MVGSWIYFEEIANKITLIDGCGSKPTPGYLIYKTRRKEFLLTKSEKKRNRINLSEVLGVLFSISLVSILNIGGMKLAYMSLEFR